MNGKDKCRILKEIRQKIADENEIEYVTRDCKFQGECRGTCPRCEAEVRYLEEQLERRKKLGKRVAIAALATGLVLGSIGCTESDSRFQRGCAPTESYKEITEEGAVPVESYKETTEKDDDEEWTSLEGEVPADSLINEQNE